MNIEQLDRLFSAVSGKHPVKTFVVMGKTFDPSKPEDYIKSFAIKRA